MKYHIKQRIVAMRLLEPLSELNIDFYVDSMGNVGRRLSEVWEHQSKADMILILDCLSTGLYAQSHGGNN